MRERDALREQQHRHPRAETVHAEGLEKVEARQHDRARQIAATPHVAPRSGGVVDAVARHIGNGHGRGQTLARFRDHMLLDIVDDRARFGEPSWLSSQRGDSGRPRRTNQISTAPPAPMIITQRQPSRPSAVYGTSR
jgi:hypothetical protein